MPLNIPVVLGTVRQENKSQIAARWILEKIKQTGINTQLVDFAELPLPFFNSPLLPIMLKGNYPDPNVQKWSEVAKAADAFIFVFPEYNHSYPAVLKNALDWLYPEFDHKPVGLAGVSNGSLGGSRAIEHLRPICENFSMFAVRETLMFAKVQDIFDLEGKLLDESFHKKFDGLIKSLEFSALAMKKARENK